MQLRRSVPAGPCATSTRARVESRIRRATFAAARSPQTGPPTLLGPSRTGSLKPCSQGTITSSPIQTPTPKLEKVADAGRPPGSAPEPGTGARTPPRGPTQWLALAIATGGGSGYAPVASGTAGAAVGVLLFWPLSALGLPLYGATVLGAVALGVWAADRMCVCWETVDDRRIVVDEIVGQLLTLAPLVPLGRAHALGWVVTGFVLFRVYDVWKPGPVRWLEENLDGGPGVVLDDVLAGVIGAATLAALVLAVGA